MAPTFRRSTTSLAASLVGILAGGALLAGCSDDPGSAYEESDIGWQVETVADGLEIPWGMAVLPDESLLVAERPGRLSIVADGETRQLEADLDDVYATGESGLMGLALSPDFETDSRFLTCQATTSDDVRVVEWTLDAAAGTATRGDDLVTGLTLNPSGRHSGCPLLIGPDDMLYVGAGDSARGGNPQDLAALGGKVLRVDPDTGEAPSDNPFVDSDDPQTRLIWTLGHRNVQGLATAEGGQVYSMEHGPDVDDEVNLLEPGDNYGWDPVGDGPGEGPDGYDESVPMTDPEIDGTVPAVWSTGDETLALSGGTFLDEKWADAYGDLAVASLKGSALYLLDLPDEAGGEVKVRRPTVLDQDYGRLRSVVTVPGSGVLYVTTSNGDDDKILKVTP